MRLVQLARNYEASGGLSFRGFVDQLELAADTGETFVQPILEEGVEGVRLMTVHGAKGLEFPVVILCDVTCKMPKSGSRRIDPEKKLFAVRLAGGVPWELLDHDDEEQAREQAEGLRVLYVAATRARDVLVVPTVADEPDRDGWLLPLAPGIFPPGKNYRLPVMAEGVPVFSGTDSVIERPQRATIPPDSGIRPGVHKPQVGSHQVVWWDPMTVDLATTPKPGIRRHQILQAHPGYPDERTEPGAVARLRWSESLAATLQEGSSPSKISSNTCRITAVPRRRSFRDTSMPRPVAIRKPMATIASCTIGWPWPMRTNPSTNPSCCG